jgi:hypothetical protein
MPTDRSERAIYAAVLATLFTVGAICAAVWKVDEHFVTRREFSELQRDVTAIRRHLGIPKPIDPASDPAGN